ncbi:MAG: lamin tail domain-containing protein, partial [Planctomycetes bacterium]|nr:lamin tail domain-containing protein [Planctomycetota bacterium]
MGFALTSSGGCGTSSVTWEDVQLTGDVISSPGDGTLPGEGEEVKVPEDPGGFCRDPLGIRINEGFFRGTDERWIELYNSTSGDVDLAGYYLTDDRNDSQKVELAADTIVPAGGYLVVTEAALGLDLSISEESNDVFLALIEPRGGRVVDAVNFRPSHDGKSESRVPDGGEMRDAAEPTPGIENRLDVETGIVINEIMYHPISNDRNREFVELYNRSDAPVDLTGWEFTSGFEFSFPDNTVVAPGGYLVVGRDPALLRSVYGLEESSVLGPVDEEALDDFGSL